MDDQAEFLSLMEQTGDLVDRVSKAEARLELIRETLRTTPAYATASEILDRFRDALNQEIDHG